MDSLPPLAKTDQAGTLTIQYSTLGIGSHFTELAGTDSLDMVVSDSITVLLQKSGYQDYLEGIRLNATGKTERTIQLVRLH